HGGLGGGKTGPGLQLPVEVVGMDAHHQPLAGVGALGLDQEVAAVHQGKAPAGASRLGAVGGAEDGGGIVGVAGDAGGRAVVGCAGGRPLSGCDYFRLARKARFRSIRAHRWATQSRLRRGSAGVWKAKSSIRSTVVLATCSRVSLAA